MRIRSILCGCTLGSFLNCVYHFSTVFLSLLATFTSRYATLLDVVLYFLSFGVFVCFILEKRKTRYQRFLGRVIFHCVCSFSSRNSSDIFFYEVFFMTVSIFSFVSFLELVHHILSFVFLD